MKKALILAAALAVVATPALAEKTAPAGKVFMFLDKFLKVPPAERTRRAENARKAYMQRLALRRSRKAATARPDTQGGDAA